MATVDESATYTLSNLFLGAGKLLGVPSTVTVGNAKPAMLSMTSTSASPHAQWFLTPTELKSYYRLHTRSGGESLSLDVVNTAGASGSTDLEMAPTGRYSGQYWRFDAWSDGTTTPFRYRMSNLFTGLEKHLDTYSDTFAPFLGDGDHTGQHWNLQVFDPTTRSHGTTRTEMPGASTATATASDAETGTEDTAGRGAVATGPTVTPVAAGGWLSLGGVVGVAIGGVAVRLASLAGNIVGTGEETS